MILPYFWNDKIHILILYMMLLNKNSFALKKSKMRVMIRSSSAIKK